MKKLNYLAASCVITFLLSLAAAASTGDMPGPGAKPAQTTPKPPICEPTKPLAGEKTGGTGCPKATTDWATEAMIIAIRLLVRVY